ncbi:predicted protein [Naegleria gruberi]|uniref:Predicted protein n=1 Tax=Naegleria gruberi TaxID=5762 RepID=D2VQ08_NAEGR|nr:uncharacterized protein NAEGRDRAFT_71121 [Naegleria gruberi]EFC41095.1 predicted protein [Naegleria gruberi]|eukprot:XP_002673839.1 predicted protein [Naegleria gruberi strain NEG-M]
MHPENSLNVTLSCIHVFASAHFCVQVFQELDFKDMTDFTVTPQLDSLTRKELFMEETPSISVMDGAESLCGTVDCDIDTLETPRTAATISTNGGGTGVSYSAFRSSIDEEFHHHVNHQLHDSPNSTMEQTTQDSIKSIVSTSTTSIVQDSKRDVQISSIVTTKERASSIVNTVSTATVIQEQEQAQVGSKERTNSIVNLMGTSGENLNAMPAQTIVNNTEKNVAASAVPNTTPATVSSNTNVVEKDEPTEVSTPKRNNEIPAIAVTPSEDGIVSPQSIKLNTTDSPSATTPTREERPRKHLSHRFKNNSDMRHFIRRAVGKTESIDIDNFHIDMRDQISADSDSSSDEEFAECND